MISSTADPTIFSSPPLLPATRRCSGQLLILIWLLAPPATEVGADETELTVAATEQFTEVQDLTPQGTQLLQSEVAESEFSVTLKSFVSPAGEAKLRSIPILAGFTTVNAYRLSDAGHVVGFAARVLGNPDGSQRGFVWSWQENQLAELPAPIGFRSSCAFDISSDGQTASGFILGRNPPRLIPCVWQRRGDIWKCQPLPTIALYNPFLSSSHVVISDDGRQVAASVAMSEEPGTGNQLRIWTQDEDESWRGRNVTRYGVHVANVNNQGMVAGRVSRKGKRVAFVYDPQTGDHLLEPLTGDASTEATDVNNRGEVVGNSDDPPGPDGGSTGFIWKVGENQIQPLEFGRDDAFSTARTIDDLGRIGGWLAWHPKDDVDAVKSGSYVLKRKR